MKPKANKSRKNSTLIHPSSVKKGTGSGNLYNYAKNSVDKQGSPGK